MTFSKNLQSRCLFLSTSAKNRKYIFNKLSQTSRFIEKTEFVSSSETIANHCSSHFIVKFVDLFFLPNAVQNHNLLVPC